MVDRRTEDKLRTLTNLPALIAFLRDDLAWPITVDHLAEATYSYDPKELGLVERYAAKVEKVFRLRRINSSQPFDIFFIEFETKAIPVMVLRRILANLRRPAADRRAWDPKDLIFVCLVGDYLTRGVAFAHFKADSDGNPTDLRTFSWDSRETHFYYLRNLNLNALRWPENPDDDVAWRSQWYGAFTQTHRATITEAAKLAEEMARQAQIIRELIADLYSYETDKGPLHKLFDRFKKDLLHSLDAPNSPIWSPKP